MTLEPLVEAHLQNALEESPLENLPNEALCDDGSPCTDDVCNPLTGCVHACNAVGPEDPCCQEPACAGSPEC